MPEVMESAWQRSNLRREIRLSFNIRAALNFAASQASLMREPEHYVFPTERYGAAGDESPDWFAWVYVVCFSAERSGK
jgi:hypothetical protein